uniref:RAS protein activator like 3 n=1 Tax=Varanus komodoensis TaxID=61221 RepID=A0A8D2LKM3_VARKO
MEASQKLQPGTETPSLLRSYRWQTVPQSGEMEPDPNLDHHGSETSKRRGKLQKWKRVQSQPESDLPVPSHEQPPPVPPQDNRVATKRSVFQRAFTTPAKMSKAQEGSGKMSLRKYLRSMSNRKNQEGPARSEKEVKETSKADDSAVQLSRLAPGVSSDAPLWDVADVSLLDRQLVALGRDEEVGPSLIYRTGLGVDPSLREGLDLGAFPTMLPAHNVCPRRLRHRSRQEAHMTVPSALSHPQGLLWRRLRDRKGRVQARMDSSAGLAVNGYRESLPGPSVLLDLANEKDALIRPLHSSLLGERYCFEVSDNCERVERALSLWVYEARDLPPRKRFLCELRLDGALYARSTTKQASCTGTIFWGEHFDLKTLPPATELQVCLVQEEEGQRPKDGAVASVAIPLKELAAVRQPLEKWYPLGRDRPNVPTLRLRGRCCNVRVLPIVQYKEFAEYLTFHYRELCAGLEHSLSARDKEELTGVLVRVLQSTGKAKDFLIDLGVAELDRFDEREALIFRENTLATKAIDEYMKLVGGPYLLATLGKLRVWLAGRQQGLSLFSR